METAIGILAMVAFVAFVIWKGRRSEPQPRDPMEDQYWAEKQEQYDNPVIEDASDDD